MTKAFIRCSKNGSHAFTFSTKRMVPLYGSDYKKPLHAIMQKMGLQKVKEHVVGYHQNDTGNTVKTGWCATWEFPATTQEKQLRAPIDRNTLSASAQDSYDLFKRSQFADDDSLFDFKQATEDSREYSWVTRLKKGEAPVIDGVQFVEADINTAFFRFITPTLSDKTEVLFHQVVLAGILYDLIAFLAGVDRSVAKFALNKMLNSPAKVLRYNKMHAGFALPYTEEEFQAAQCVNIFKALWPVAYKEIRSLASKKGQAFFTAESVETRVMKTVKAQVKRSLSKSHRRGCPLVKVSDIMVRKHDALFVHPEYFNRVEQIMNQVVMSLGASRGQLNDSISSYQFFTTLCNSLSELPKIKAIRNRPFIDKQVSQHHISENIREKYTRFMMRAQ
jgi:hypothetical protein